MPRIYELDEQQRDILDKLYFLDENEEEDAAEIESLKKELLKIRGGAAGTIEFLSKILLESKAILEAREEAKKRAERRRKTAEKSVERLTNVMQAIMHRFNITKISTDLCDISIQKNAPGLHYADNFDVSTLPDDCIKVEVKPIAAAIKTRIKAGEFLYGVTLEHSESLRVR